jgi:hypothetical protein
LLGPLTPIPAPPNRQPNTGLLSLAERPTVVADDNPGPGQVSARWVGGFGFEPEACDAGQSFEIDCVVYGVGESKAIDLATDPNAAAVTYSPVVFVVADACSTMTRERDRRGRVIRHLMSVESEKLAQLLWTGEVTDTVIGDLPLSRMHLADGNATELAAGAAMDFVHGFAVMDQFLTTCLHNVQGMIHMTPYTLARLVERGAVLEVNGRLLSPNGNLLVADAGYTGGGPRPTPAQALPAAPDMDAAVPPDQWIYGTPMVHVLLGDPENQSDINRAVNTENTNRERAGAAFWGGCCQYAAQLTFVPEA